MCKVEWTILTENIRSSKPSSVNIAASHKLILAQIKLISRDTCLLNMSCPDYHAMVRIQPSLLTSTIVTTNVGPLGWVRHENKMGRALQDHEKDTIRQSG